jgi:hypothetical protein
MLVSSSAFEVLGAHWLAELPKNTSYDNYRIPTRAAKSAASFS